jgi:hypothetical protein
MLLDINGFTATQIRILNLLTHYPSYQDLVMEET